MIFLEFGLKSDGFRYLKYASVIFTLNIYVSASKFKEDFRKAVSKKQIENSSIYSSFSVQFLMKHKENDNEAKKKSTFVPS